MEGSLLGTHTYILYIIITKFIAIASSCQLSNLSLSLRPLKLKLKALAFAKLKLPSTFVLALVEEMLTPLNSLYFSTQLSLKILAKQSKTAKKMLAFDC